MSRCSRSIRHGLLLLVTAAVFGYVITHPPGRYGDGQEYMLQTESLYRHGSPDLQPGDLCSVDVMLSAAGIDSANPPEGGYHHSKSSDRLFCWHFWMYPLSAVPARAMLDLIDGEPLQALPLTNGFWLIGATAFGLYGMAGPLARRLRFVALSLVSPAVWYLPYTGPEMMTWSLVTMAVISLDRGWYPATAFLAGLAATQNPPIVLLVGMAVLFALGQRSLRSILTSVVLGSVVFLAPAFYLTHYGTPSLITRAGYTDPSLLSLDRTLSIFTDLNQGILPFAPVLLGLALLGWFRILIQADRLGIALTLVLAGMVAMVQSAINWNMGAQGLIRYAIWMLPILVWFASEVWGAMRFGLRLFVGIAIVAQGVVLIVQAPGRLDYIRPTPIASWVWEEIPALYNPDHHIFMVRCLETEVSASDDLLPIAYISKKGEITKILLDRSSADRMEERFFVDPRYRSVIEEAARDHPGRFYLHPPRDAVRLWPGSNGRPPLE